MSDKRKEKVISSTSLDNLAQLIHEVKIKVEELDRQKSGGATNG